MITDDIVQRSEWGDVVILGGNFVRWYGGFDSYVVGKEFQPEYKLGCVSMGRKQQMEDQIEDITYTPYVQWREWIDVLSQYHVGVHLMPTIAAGTFAMNCAFHGIPCIGYDEADTQRKCHPDLSVKELKKFIKQSRTKYNSLKDCRIQWNDDTYKWMWMKETSTLEFFL